MPIPVPDSTGSELAASLVATDSDRLLQAEALVRAYCRWHIAPSRSGETYRLQEAGPLILLPSLHVTAVSVTDAAGETVDPATYTWSEPGVVRAACGWWAAGTTVTYTHGYDYPPAEVTGVVQAVGQRAFDNPGSKPREQTGPFTDTYSQAGLNQAPALVLLDAEKTILDAYRIP